MFYSYGKLGRRVTEEMYLAFDCGIGPTQHTSQKDTTTRWEIPEKEKTRRFGYPDCVAEDEVALRRLLAGLGVGYSEGEYQTYWGGDDESDAE